MKPFHYVVIGILAGAVGGFILAWQLKPADGNPESAAATPLRTKVERRPTILHPSGKPVPSAFSRQWEEADQTDDTEEKRKALLAALDSDEFPQLLAEISGKSGFNGLDFVEIEQLHELFKAWHAKAPEAALEWLRALPKAEDRQQLLCEIVDEAAEIDLEGALALLRQNARDDGYISIPNSVLEKAAGQGASKLLEVCKLGIGANERPVFSSWSVSYPEDFDFKRVLDDLAATQAAFREGERFGAVPSNLLSEWGKRDFQAALAWIKERKTVPENGFSDLVAAVAPAEAGVLLASTFDPAAPEGERYKDVGFTLYRTPSPEILEAFLQAAPGERSMHLDSLFDLPSSLGELQALLLERMSTEQRAEALRRRFKNGTDPEIRSSLSRLLRGLGHSEEEIHSLLPARQQ